MAIGVPGEIWLGGGGVTRGYLGRAELTAEKYVPGAGGRWYRTGDLGRWLTAGTIEFLGRMDQQVKVRGFRVELGEIESALAAHPGVREAVVLGRSVGGDVRLVAYVVPLAGSETAVPSAEELAGSLRRLLPEYMVPSAFLHLEALPRTVHGKLDRAALPSPESWSLGSRAPYVAPRTAVEEVVAGCWREVLGLDQVSVEDDFFALGGHSLMATQAISRVSRAFGVQVPLRQLFEAPTIALLARYLEDHAPAAPGGEPSGPGEPGAWHEIERGAWAPGAPLPLSFAQERLWFLDQLDPGSASYNLTTALRFTGALDAAALARGLDEIVRRQGSLRTTFAGLDGRPAQVVHAAVELPCPLIDLRALPEAPRAAELRRLVVAEAVRPFDLARGPLLRATLLRLSEGEHAGLFTVHHIVSDGWSMGVLVGELEALYAAAVSGRCSPLPELPIQYADFTLWQRAWLTGERLAGQLGYWREALAGLTDFELPADRPRPPFLTGRGGRGTGAHRLDIPRQLARRLEELGPSRGATLFMTLLAAWSALLQRSAGRDDVAVGTAVANRDRPEIEGLIGFFVNTLVLRVDCAGDPSFAGLLERVRRSALDAYAHQDLPFEKLVEELRPQRDASRTPLFQLMFALQSARPGQLALPGVVVEPIALESTDAKFDMSLNFAATPDGLVGSWVYKRDLFDAATVARWAGHLANLLAGVAAAPGAALSALPLLSAAERQQLVVEWSEAGWTAGWSVAPGSSVPALVEARAAERPRAVAVRFEGESLTYRDLSRRSAVLARRLAALGVGAESRVGLLVSRSADLVAAILGIWKAGGAYVALDPGLPLERLSFMVEDALHGSRSPVLVADGGQRELLAALPLAGVQVLLWDDLREELAAGDLEDGARAIPDLSGIAPSHLAYLIYTSGTTGRPKAVAVEHGSLARSLGAAVAAFGFGAEDRMPCLAAASFDIFLFEAFGPLLGGGTTVLWRLQPALDLGELVAGLPEMTLLHAVPALMRQVVEGARHQGGAGDRLRRVFVGGDAVPPELLSDLVEVFPRAAVTVLYGPTEGTILAASLTVSGPGPAGHAIGRPLPGARLELRDRSGEAVAIGVPGEIWLGGGGVTRGYLGRAELTAEKYVPGAGGRWYRTGDLGRWLPAGTIEFLGRMDQQVKVRGFRVELGEIESALAAHPGVREAVVLGRSVGGDVRLVAYVVPLAGSETAVPSAEELAGSLRRLLPEYMVPSAFLHLEALPRTVHGKLDRAALPSPESWSLGSRAPYVAPRTAVEEVVAGFWSEILGLATVGVEDDFFALGGHSLMATQVISRVSRIFGVQVPLRQLFGSPTVAAIAAAVLDHEAAPGRSEKIARARLKVSRMSAESKRELLSSRQGAAEGA